MNRQQVELVELVRLHVLFHRIQVEELCAAKSRNMADKSAGTPLVNSVDELILLVPGLREIPRGGRFLLLEIADDLWIKRQVFVRIRWLHRRHTTDRRRGNRDYRNGQGASHDSVSFGAGLLRKILRLVVVLV